MKRPIDTNVRWEDVGGGAKEIGEERQRVTGSKEKSRRVEMEIMDPEGVREKD